MNIIAMTIIIALFAVYFYFVNKSHHLIIHSHKSSIMLYFGCNLNPQIAAITLDIIINKDNHFATFLLTEV